MKEQLQLKNHLKEVRTEANLSQTQLTEMVEIIKKYCSSIETGQFNPTARWLPNSLYCIGQNLGNYSIFRRVIMENIIMLILGVFISVVEL